MPKIKEVLIHDSRQMGLDSFFFPGSYFGCWSSLDFFTFSYSLLDSFFSTNSEKVQPDLIVIFLQNRAKKMNWMCVGNS